MNLRNPPTFDHIVAFGGQNLKVFYAELGDLTLGVGTVAGTIAIPAGLPAVANVVGFTASHRPSGTRNELIQGWSRVNTTNKWNFTASINPSTLLLTVNAWEVNNLVLANATLFSQISVVVWYF